MRFAGNVVVGAVALLMGAAACSNFTAAEAGAQDDAATDSPDLPEAMADGLADGDSGRDSAAPEAGARKRVFVTSTRFAASQLGSAGSVFDESDGLCNQAAVGLNPPGAFRAWITDGVISANAPTSSSLRTGM